MPNSRPTLLYPVAAESLFRNMCMNTYTKNNICWILGSSKVYLMAMSVKYFNRLFVRFKIQWNQTYKRHLNAIVHSESNFLYIDIWKFCNRDSSKNTLYCRNVSYENNTNACEIRQLYVPRENTLNPTLQFKLLASWIPSLTFSLLYSFTLN